MALTFLLTWLHIQYDDGEPKPICRLIQAALGSLIVMVVSLSSAWSFADAGFINLIGVEQIR